MRMIVITERVDGESQKEQWRIKVVRASQHKRAKSMFSSFHGVETSPSYRYPDSFFAYGTYADLSAALDKAKEAGLSVVKI